MVEQAVSEEALQGAHETVQEFLKRRGVKLSGALAEEKPPLPEDFTGFKRKQIILNYLVPRKKFLFWSFAPFSGEHLGDLEVALKERLPENASVKLDLSNVFKSPGGKSKQWRKSALHLKVELSKS